MADNDDIKWNQRTPEALHARLAYWVYLNRDTTSMNGFVNGAIRQRLEREGAPVQVPAEFIAQLKTRRRPRQRAGRPDPAPEGE